ncbi:uncharacterized protein LOC104584307 [Brachypodium distachyon]|uniref:Interferon-related developmental regulator N-terminal domain-containing protein n=1 Tax=Brachypodium distachyon TaxID=15368 RepID=I1IDT1_BRADI|nr:uncharacterized protein LOC104584307 [Brachypodium distachyon]PNT69425.1 hypothetical protein BRADI_3g55070v3 [Brachypodium distachyon]|eukprot:XP_010236868.1 uncharacterized protein LOC104584307 [Brachypodium distachyon]
MPPGRWFRDYARVPAPAGYLSTRSGFNNFGGMENLDVIDTCVNGIHEKRRSKREAGIAGLVGALEEFVPMDRIDYRCLTALEGCKASLLGRQESALLAYRAIGLLALTVGANRDCSEEILANVLALPVFSKPRSMSGGTARAALDCLAAVTFAAARCPEDAEPSIKIIWAVIKHNLAGTNASNTDIVLNAALSAWALLLTTLGGNLRTQPHAWKEAMFPYGDLVKLLDTDDSAVLTAAGEALAVCAELNLTRHATPKDMQALESKVADLASGSRGVEEDYDLTGEQCVMFRQISTMVKAKQEQGDGWEEEDLMMRRSAPSSQRCVLKVSKWARLVQLNFLKRFLGKGFVKHARDNPLLQENSSDAAAVDEVPSGKSKQCRFGREKQWSVALRRDRMIGWENKNAFSQLL